MRTFLVTLISLTWASAQYVSLFNGTDLTNWEIKAHAADMTGGYVYVENGAIVMDGHDANHDYVWCYSEKEYTDFRLRLKFQGIRGEYANSGIQVRSRYDHNDGGGWLNGPQIDIGFPHNIRNGSIWDETRNNQQWIFGGYEYNNAAPFFWNDEGTGWNDLEVIVTGLHIIAIQNGDTITNYDGTGVLDDANHLNLGVGTTGHIALQIHTSDIMKIRYKDIEIMDLSQPPDPVLNLLVFSKIAGFSHESIGWVEAEMLKLGAEKNWNVRVTNNSSLFVPGGLDTFNVVLWNNNCSDSAILKPDEMAVFEKYIRDGGGYVGIHGAAWSNFTPRWTWYIDTLVGARETDNGGTWEGVWNGPAVLKVELANDPATAMIPADHVWNDEYYAFSRNIRLVEYPDPADEMEILVSGIADWDYGDYRTGHPATWRHTVPGGSGRAWISGPGHNQATIEDPVWLAHVAAGIEWAGAAGSTPVFPLPEKDITSITGHQLNFTRTPDGIVFHASTGLFDRMVIFNLQGKRAAMLHGEVDGMVWRSNLESSHRMFIARAVGSAGKTAQRLIFK